ncbi:MAG: hypothetical protein AB1512_23665 [Thermodesulfobacteriota bacterium]
MKRKGKRTSTGLWILAVAALALAAGYFLGKEPASEDRKPPVGREAPPPPKGLGSKVEAQIPARGDGVLQEQAGDARGEGQAECGRVQEEVRDFFRYLDEKPYVQHIEEGLDSYAWFKRILKKLSAHLPTPAGEGLDNALLASNAFHFFRHLEAREIRLILEILLNEASTLEANLDLFFRWLTLGGRCPDPERVRPSSGILYSYAGFFMNTLGGQSYLYRRPGTVRVLASYYCLLILHEADKKGRNRHGIDLAPRVKALAEEMSLHGELQFQKQYSRRLSELQALYPIRR